MRTPVENDSELLARLRDPAYPGNGERAIVFTVDATPLTLGEEARRGP